MDQTPAEYWVACKLLLIAEIGWLVGTLAQWVWKYEACIP